jgi:hypothetical protein
MSVVLRRGAGLVLLAAAVAGSLALPWIIDGGQPAIDGPLHAAAATPTTNVFVRSLPLPAAAKARATTPPRRATTSPTRVSAAVPVAVVTRPARPHAAPAATAPTTKAAKHAKAKKPKQPKQPKQAKKPKQQEQVVTRLIAAAAVTTPEAATDVAPSGKAKHDKTQKHEKKQKQQKHEQAGDKHGTKHGKGN